MASNPNSPLNAALIELGTTVNSITQKITDGKTKVNEYKVQIKNKLSEVNKQLEVLKNGNQFQIIPQLRKQLEETQGALQDKTSQLQTTQTELTSVNENLSQLQNRLNTINQELEQKNNQIRDLSINGQQKDSQITQLTNQITQLTEEKAEIERNLAASQQDASQLVNQISQINNALKNQINLIQTISTELGDINNGEIGEQFKAVQDNISAIMVMLNDQGQGQQRGGKVKLGKNKKTKRRKTLQTRKKKTIKKRKQRGGYTYQTNKELEKSSKIMN
jgi:chromosome segregation ATPase